MTETMELVESIEQYKKRLTDEVIDAYSERGESFGNQRFNAWKKRFLAFLDKELPGESNRFNNVYAGYGLCFRNKFETDVDYFWRRYGEKTISYVDSLIIDIDNNEYEPYVVIEDDSNSEETSETDKNSVFIVHGHNCEAKEKTARFVEKLGYKAIILHEQASGGQTIIEKIEKHSDVGFGIVLYTPDDMGNIKSQAETGELNQRARQNVVFEHGYLIGRIGRDKVIPLVTGDIELPNDISGMVYLTDNDWQVDIAKEMKNAGYDIDFNKIL